MNHDKSLQDIIFSMLCDQRHTFYGLFLAELNKSFEEPEKMPTACIGKHINSPVMELVLGKKFWEKTCYNESRKKAILIHELEHVMRDHLSDFSQGIYPNKKVANMAMDIAINQDIQEELPRTDEDGKKIGIFIEDFPELKLQKNQSTLHYYNVILKAQQEKQDSKKDGKDSKSPEQKKGNCKGTCGSGEMDKWLDALEDGTMPDWHDRWDDITKDMGDKERELYRKEMQEMIRRIADETEKLRGTIPGYLQDAMKADFGNKPPVISWKTLFNRFIGSTLTTDIRQTRKRPNFRFEDAPTNKYKNKVKIVCGLDSSGF